MIVLLTWSPTLSRGRTTRTIDRRAARPLRRAARRPADRGRSPLRMRSSPRPVLTPASNSSEPFRPRSPQSAGWTRRAPCTMQDVAALLIPATESHRTAPQGAGRHNRRGASRRLEGEVAEETARKPPRPWLDCWPSVSAVGSDRRLRPKVKRAEGPGSGRALLTFWVSCRAGQIALVPDDCHIGGYRVPTRLARTAGTG